MKKYDKLLLAAMKTCGILKYVKPGYLPYSIMRLKLNYFLRKYLNHNDGIHMVLVTDSNFKEQYCGKIKNSKIVSLDETTINEIVGSEELAQYLEKKIRDQVRSIVFCLPFRDNLSVLSRIYSARNDWDIIDIYDVLEQNGIYTCYSDICLRRNNKKEYIKNGFRQFFQYYEMHSRLIRKILYRFNRSGKCPWFLEVFCTHRKYVEKGGDFYTKKYLAELIISKDFYSLFKELKKIDQTEKWMDNLENKINAILSELRECIKKRRSKAVVWNFVDNVSYHKMTRDMPFLNNEREKGLDFKNTYSQMPWTSWTFKAIFSGKQVIKDKLFLLGKVGENIGEYKYYDELLKKGYQIYFLGRKDNRQKLPIPEESKYGLDALHETYNYSTEKQWRALTLLAEKDEKLFLLIHNFCETHTPFITPAIDTIEGFSFFDSQVSEEQKKESRLYLDRELNWYADYYFNTVRVYMSDHGDKDNSPLSRYNYSDERTHLMFFVIADGIDSSQVDCFVSVKDEIAILLSIIDDVSYENYLNDCITIECYDSYSKDYVERIIDKVQNLDVGEWMQFQAYRTKNEKYVLFNNGEERYYILPDEDNDVSTNEQYKDRVKELRKKLEVYMINVSDYSFFKESKKLYEVLENHEA